MWMLPHARRSAPSVPPSVASKWAKVTPSHQTMGQLSFYERHGKRWLDLALTVPALIAFAPLFLFLYVAVRWRLGRPVLFRQQRPGWREIPFTLVKFRTMTDERDADGMLLPD